MAQQAHPARRPRSPAQIDAARRNGARSRGPRTAAGKARSARNALRHGLCATVHLVTAEEDPRALAGLRAALARELGAAGVLGACLVERLAVALWKLARCDRLEARLHALAARHAPGCLDPEPGLPAALSRLPELATLWRHRGQLGRELLQLLRWLGGRPDRPAPASPLAAVPLDGRVEPGHDKTSRAMTRKVPKAPPRRAVTGEVRMAPSRPVTGRGKLRPPDRRLPPSWPAAEPAIRNPPRPLLASCSAPEPSIHRPSLWIAGSSRAMTARETPRPDRALTRGESLARAARRSARWAVEGRRPRP